MGFMNEGSRALAANIKLKEPLPPGKYYVAIKGINYDAPLKVRLAAGGDEATVKPDADDDNKYWTELVPLNVKRTATALMVQLVKSGSAQENEKLLLMGMYVTADPFEAILPSDQVVRLKFPTQRDRSPARATNLARNGSFETGIGHGWAVTEGRKFSLASIWDPTEGVDGSASLKLPLDPAASLYENISLISRSYKVAPNKKHTFSVSMKANVGSRVRGTLRLVNSYGTSSGGPFPRGAPPQHKIEKTFEVGDRWTRIDLTGDLLEYPTAAYNTEILAEVGKGKDLWIDAVSLNEGGAVAFAPAAPLEVGLTSDQPSNVFYEDEPQKMDLRVANQTARGGPGTVRYEVYDYLNQKVAEGRRAVKVPPRSVVRQSLEFGIDRRGAFRVVLWVDGQERSQEEVLFSVVPRPQRAGRDPSSSIGIHSPFYGFTFDAMSKLGIKWDRDLSPAAFLRWHEVEPKDDKFIWFDKEVELANRRGVSQLGVLGTNEWPKWADRDGRPDLDKWEEFVTQSVRHYRGKVPAWEVWNEPSSIFEADFYAKMLKRAAEAIRRVDPDSTVVAMGGVAPEYVKAVVDELAKQFPEWQWERDIDVLSIHRYPTREVQEPSSTGEVDVYRKLISSYKKPVWNTETGSWDLGFFHTDNAPIGRWGKNLFSYKSGEQFTDASQGSVESLATNFLETTGNGLSKYFYYDVRLAAMPNYYKAHPTMLEYDDTIRPKGVAYAVLAKLFDHASGQGKLSFADKSAQAFLYSRQGASVVGLSTVDNSQKAITLPGVPADDLKAYDSMGNPIAVDGGRVLYGRRPVYLEAKGIAPRKLRAAFKAGTVESVADTTPPNLSIDEGPRGVLTNSTVALRWNAADGSATPDAIDPDAIAYSYRLTGPDRPERWSAWGADSTLELTGLKAGRYTFEVKARDAAKNESPPITRRVQIASVK